jgi:lambda repressor-like predicted transcriptional regulator
MQDYRQIIRAELARRNWSIRELSRQSGVSHVTLAEWLREPPRTDMLGVKLARVALALGLELRPAKEE